MKFELLPRIGLMRPRGGGLLGFGVSRERARRRLDWFGPVTSPFVCGVEWLWRVQIADRIVEAWSGDDGLPGEITVARSVYYAWGQPAGIPAVYQGIDVFADGDTDTVRLTACAALPSTSPPPSTRR